MTTPGSVIERKITYSVQGRGVTAMYGLPHPLTPSDTEGHAQIAVFPKSRNFTRGGGGDGPAFVDRTVTESGLAPHPWANMRTWNHTSPPVTLPALSVQDGDYLGAYVWARAESRASSGGVAGAAWGYTDLKEDLGYSVYPVSADFTIMAPADLYWDDHNCVY